jgi:hypothetical protein
MKICLNFSVSEAFLQTNIEEEGKEKTRRSSLLCANVHCMNSDYFLKQVNLK